ncbi:hypothetical protein BGW36DRAFT_456731 [Talaromyces proteolyticus]|uniref:Ecp2 effector protein domain-containing protein n=1 Tax=Talaromyces proteolyticus TaxID=1131652 RepID=A0AAD4L251_9EURO|nr:uncharacterized protein BGW36DRAFT_456731 [Talaromyces proteolyticus]KAH8705231.1 hypothetical protein BGW36DRAFT_456731 [Talaromyces proteolyticus]
MKTAIFGPVIASLISLTNAYNLTLYTDTACSEGGTDFSHADFQGDQGTVGQCMDIGFTAHSIYFTQDSDTEQQFSGWAGAENCVASEEGQNEADVTIYTGQPEDESCTDIDNGIYDQGRGIQGFLVGVVG